NLYNVDGKVAGDPSGNPTSGAQTANMYYQIDDGQESPRTEISAKLSISGTITQDGNGLAGVLVSASGQSDTTAADVSSLAARSFTETVACPKRLRR
ncbi:MAG: hypothetical protein GWP05_00685, partial [Anaerolineaceae bacterium]|nr:hypothetical protein [Anaerolineaceae bacterium]